MFSSTKIKDVNSVVLPRLGFFAWFRFFHTWIFYLFFTALEYDLRLEYKI